MITGLIILLPLILSLVVIFSGDKTKIRNIALTGALAEFLLSLYCLFIFLTRCHCELLMNIPLAEHMGINFRFGMDIFSLLFVLLTNSMVLLILFIGRDRDLINPSAFYGRAFLMEFAFTGLFTSFNGIVLFIFWVLALLTAYVTHTGWGSNDRVKITFRYFIIIFFCALLLMTILICLYIHTQVPHSFDLEYLYSANLAESLRIMVFIGFLMAFTIPIFIIPVPFRRLIKPAAAWSWYGIVVIMAIYGLIRILLPVFP